MILALPLPRILPEMTSARVLALHAAQGSLLKSGTALLDVTVDLSAIAPQDCPPVSHYRIALREAVWLRRLACAPGEDKEVGAMLAIFSTDAEEPFDTAPARTIRHMIAGIVVDWQDGTW